MRRLLISGVSVILMFTLWGQPTSAGAPPTDPVLRIDPTTGTVFTNYLIVGDECDQADPPGSWSVYAEGGAAPLVSGGVAPDATGFWDNTFSGVALPGPGDYRLEAMCSDQFAYDPVAFTVVGATNNPVLTVEPATGPVGGEFLFRGTACPQGIDSGQWTLYSVATGEGLGAGPAAPENDGTWTEGIPNWPFGPGEFRLEATCAGGDFDYEPAYFTVTDAEPAPAPVPAPSPAPAPAPAAPVPGTSTFTG